MRTTWNGSISFGLVSIPVGLAPGDEAAARASDVSFRMLHRECGTPIKQKRWCPVHERDLEPDEIVKGWEVAKGQFVLVEDEELEAMTLARRLALDRDLALRRRRARSTRSSSTAPTSSFPRRRPRARRPYVLLLNAMRETGMAAIGRFVLQGKREALPDPAQGRRARARDAVPLSGRVLAGRDRGGGRGDDAEGARARARAAGDREPRRRLRPGGAPERLPPRPAAMLEAKLAGEEITAPEPVAEEAPVIDLMEALRRSVEDAKQAKQPAAPRRRREEGCCATQVRRALASHDVPRAKVCATDALRIRAAR